LALQVASRSSECEVRSWVEGGGDDMRQRQQLVVDRHVRQGVTESSPQETLVPGQRLTNPSGLALPALTTHEGSQSDPLHEISKVKM
jgi:hypothetical protein